MFFSFAQPLDLYSRFLLSDLRSLFSRSLFSIFTKKWTDEECRYYLQLLSGERRKGNRTKTGLNQTAKDFIVKMFEDKYRRGYTWEKFMNKYDTCKRAYKKLEKVIHNRTKLGYDVMGRVDMSDDWWEERIKEWPGARNVKNKLIPNAHVYKEKLGVISDLEQKDGVHIKGKLA